MTTPIRAATAFLGTVLVLAGCGGGEGETGGSPDPPAPPALPIP